MDVEGRTAIKSSKTINIPIEKTVEFFKNPQFMKNLQDNVVKVDIPYSKGNIKVLHAVVKMPGPVSNRQMVVVNTFHQEGDKVIIGNRSCNYPVQLDKDAELAQAYVAGFIFEKVDAGKTKVTNISDMDPKGSIPGFVKNAIASKRAEILINLEQKIKDYKG